MIGFVLRVFSFLRDYTVRVIYERLLKRTWYKPISAVYFCLVISTAVRTFGDNNISSASALMQKQFHCGRPKVLGLFSPNARNEDRYIIILYYAT